MAVTHPKLAVLIPTYNAGPFLESAFQSLERAGVRPGLVDAVYVSDDASHDGTVALARRLWRGDVPLRLLAHQDNVGECGNVNRAMAALACDGIKWAVLLHQDDLLEAGWIDVVTDRLRIVSDDVCVVCCHPAERNGSSAFSGASFGDLTHPGGEVSLRRLRHRWFWSISASAFRVEGYIRAGGMHPGLTYAAENDLLCRLFLGGCAVLEVRGAYLVKRAHDQSQTSRNARLATDAIAWCYIMHRYLRYSSKRDRILQYARWLRLLMRRAVAFARGGHWRSAAFQLGAIGLMARSLAGILTGLDGLIPTPVRRLLRHSFDAYATSAGRCALALPDGDTAASVPVASTDEGCGVAVTTGEQT